jgi:hypothetical protein
MAAEDAAQQARALQQALEHSGWFDGSWLQDALYEWAESRVPVAEVRAWLAADIVRADDASALRELGISAEQVRAAQLGERISMGALSIEEAARMLFDMADLGDIRRQVRAQGRATRPTAADEATQLRNGLMWWRLQLQRVASLTDAIPADLRTWARAEVREINDDGLLGVRDMAGEWGSPVTIAVARQELDRLTRLRFTDHPEPSGPLLQLTLGSLAIEELNRRLARRLEAAIADPPAYLLAMLGPYPPSDAAQLTWTQAALDVEDFRLEYQITDAQQALGAADIAMLLDQRERFHTLNRSLTRARIELDRGESGRTGNADRRGRRSSGDTDPKPNQPAGRQEPNEGLPRDVPAGLTGAGTAEAGADLRPDEQITEHLRGLAQVLPPPTRAAAARLSDEDLTAHWQTAMAFSLGRDLGPPNELGFHTEIEVGPDGGSPRVRGHDANLPAAAASAPLLEAAAVIEELDRRVEAKVQAAIADPPAYILRVLGSWPHDPGASALWEVEAVEIEQYRLVTGTSDPIHPLGPPEPPGSSWRQCWWRALTQDLAQCGSTWMRYRHSVFGSAEEHADVANVVVSATDPRLSVRPDGAMLAEQEDLPTSTLRSRVVHAAALLAGSWPPSRSGELAVARGRHVELERYAQEQRFLLDAARPRRARPGLAITPRARAARAAVKTIIGKHEQALGRLHERLADAAREITQLERAQDAYLAWRTEHGRFVAQGQAAARVLQAREDRLLDELAVYPPAYLLVELGPPPANPEGRAAWRRGAQTLERYRATYRIHDPYRTLADDVQGVATMGVRWWEKERDRVREEVGGVRRAITESLAHELDRGRALPGPDDPPGPINEW